MCQLMINLIYCSCIIRRSRNPQPEPNTDARWQRCGHLKFSRMRGRSVVNIHLLVSYTPLRCVRSVLARANSKKALINTVVHAVR